MQFSDIRSKMKPIKLSSVQDVHQIGEQRLRRMLLKKKITIKIKDKVDPAVAARIFRVLGDRIDKLRWKMKEDNNNEKTKYPEQTN